MALNHMSHETKGPGTNDDASPSDPSASTEFYSACVDSMRKLNVSDAETQEQVEIAASKAHWSELKSDYYSAVEGPGRHSTSELRELESLAEDNQEVFRSLQVKYPGGFFYDDHENRAESNVKPHWMLDDEHKHMSKWEVRLSSAKPFAEGAQAELYHAHWIVDDGTKYESAVMKVFKEGTSLRDLQNLLPPAMLTDEAIHTHGDFKVGRYCNSINGARLLKTHNGRFAIIMFRHWGDLRKLIELRMERNKHGPPLSNDLALLCMFHIALGMQSLHARNLVHRDLKAANVLISGKHDPFDPLRDDFDCMVADYECLLGVVGTKFWRAPEILLGIKNRELKPEVFTKESDVYSYGMTCYEILTGQIPLESVRANDYDVVIGGVRPELPGHVTPRITDLLNSCWHMDPSERPSFQEVIGLLRREWRLQH